jgi:hypothetical protein
MVTFHAYRGSRIIHHWLGYNKGMAKSSESYNSSGNWAERGSRVLRNMGIIGAVALGGAAVVFPELGLPLLDLAVLSAGSAVLFEGTRRLSARSSAKLKPV